MKFLLWSLAITTIIAGCAPSSKKSNNQDHASSISLEKPGEQSYQPSRVYVDSVKKISIENRYALLINGTFPDGCTKLEEVTHHVQNDSLHLEFKAWRDPNMMCAQVLTPFTYIYDKLGDEELSSHSEVIINGTAYNY